LWIPQREEAILLVPLFSWVAPANRGDRLFLEPSLRYLHKHLEFTPRLVVADMAYINMEMQRRLREEMQVAVITRLPPNYDIAEELRPAVLMQCRQGQRLEWLGLRENEQRHWFGVTQCGAETLCSQCWEASACPREFSFAPTDHEVALGSIPLSSRTGQRLLNQSRTWIEASQSYEKLQLGLGSMFLNSLRLAAIMSMLADTVMLLRAHALLSQPATPNYLAEMLPSQLRLELE
jgi:hypothetical protein